MYSLDHVDFEKCRIADAVRQRLLDAQEGPLAVLRGVGVERVAELDSKTPLRALELDLAGMTLYQRLSSPEVKHNIGGLARGQAVFDKIARPDVDPIEIAHLPEDLFWWRIDVADKQAIAEARIRVFLGEAGTSGFDEES